MQRQFDGKRGLGSRVEGLTEGELSVFPLYIVRFGRLVQVKDVVWAV